MSLNEQTYKIITFKLMLRAATQIKPGAKSKPSKEISCHPFSFCVTKLPLMKPRAVAGTQ